MVQLTQIFQTLLLAAVFAVQIESASSQGIDLSLQQRSSGGSFNLEKELQALRRRYDPSTPSEVSHRALRRAVGDVHAAGYNKNLNNYYYVPVKVGTPPQELNLVLDTASTSSWLSILNEPSVPITPFKANASSTYVVLRNATADNGDGPKSGVIGADTFQLGSFNVPAQPFYLSRLSGPDRYFSDDISGYLGFGRGSQTELDKQLTSFWTKLQETDHLTNKNVGFYLTRPTAPKTPSRQLGGIVTLGGTNTTLYTGDIEFHNPADALKDSDQWTVEIHKVTVNGREFPQETRRSAVIDTTTSFISGPSAEVAKFWAAVPNSQLTTTNVGAYSFPCSQQINVTISFGGRDWPISSEDINLGPLAAGNERCYGAIVDIEKRRVKDEPLPNDPRWVLGTSFLRNTYFVLSETTPPSVGFAQLSDAARSGTVAPTPTGQFRAIPIETTGMVSAGSKVSGTTMSSVVFVFGAALATMLF